MGDETFPEFYRRIKAGFFPKPQVVVSVSPRHDSRTLRSHSKSSSNSSLNQQQSSSTPLRINNYLLTLLLSRTIIASQTSSSKKILGEGRSENPPMRISWRYDCSEDADLSKAPSRVLEEMQKEVEIIKTSPIFKASISPSWSVMILWRRCPYPIDRDGKPRIAKKEEKVFQRGTAQIISIARWIYV
ncbi:uncharacterized protein OCT59_014228 [Rhizophagus irregularis]|uniref:uncharacterized protein n=1 Tax=Rhizophagus irregularis TaxID=588596 RepID=UPI00331CC08C|nr:hypothetical protein OCT59_014228 [Rhizophagus irregularis]